MELHSLTVNNEDSLTTNVIILGNSLLIMPNQRWQHNFCLSCIFICKARISNKAPLSFRNIADERVCNLIGNLKCYVNDAGIICVI